MSDARPERPAARRRGWGGQLGLALGVGLLVALTLGFGWRPVLAAAASVHPLGFIGVCVAWVGVLALLGSAWMLVAPGGAPGVAPGGAPRVGAGDAAGVGPGRLAGFAWARAVREAASDLLPFSQFGGLVAGADAAARATGLAGAVIWASLVVDLTAEMAAQLVYTLAGVAGLGWRLTRPDAAETAAAGAASGAAVLWGGFALLAAGAVVTGGFVVMQRRGVAWAASLAQRWLPGAMKGAADIQLEMDRAYARRGALLASVGVHGAGWIASGLVSWWMLRLMGAPLPLLDVLTVESLMYAAKSFGFAIPGALGVQEAAYALIGPLFGLPPQTALALSLLKRARDIAVGAPTLVIWRVAEARRAARLRAEVGAVR